MTSRVLSPIVVLGLLAAAAAQAPAQQTMEQELAKGLARTFRSVADTCTPRTVCLRLRVGDRRGYGTAALISADGLAVTCAHVVEVSPRIDAVTSDGRVHAVTVLGRNSDNDYALVRLEGGPFPFFPLGDSDRLEVGQWVAALGHPGGPYADHRPAFAVGRVTGLHKKLPLLMQKKFYDDAVKTNVPIFAGNSGGPLVDLSGRLVGVNGAILLVNENAYAIPVNEISKDLPALRQGRDVAGRKAGDIRKLMAELQQEMNPEDMKRLYDRSPLGRMLGRFLRAFGGGGKARGPRPPTRNEFLTRYFRPLNRAVSPAVVVIVSGGERKGYGVVVDPEGWILANYRAAGEGPVSVRVPGKGLFRGEVAGRHGPLDAALLRVRTGFPLEAARLGSASGLRPGDWVVTAAPGETPLAVSVVSAVDRSIGTRRKVPTLGLFGMFGTPNESPLRPYERVVHHDATITDGQFGSPLFDAEGRLVGLNAATFYRGSSFAVPVEALAPVLAELKEGLHVAPPETYGPDVQSSPFGGGEDLFGRLFENLQKLFESGEFDLEKLFRGEMDLEKLLEKLLRPGPGPDGEEGGRPFLGVSIDTAETERVVVASVVEGSAAARAGVRPGDAIVSLHGKKVTDLASLREAVASVAVGGKTKLVVERGGRRLTLEAVMGSR